MGVDALIYVECKGVLDDLYLPYGYYLELCPDDGIEVFDNIFRVNTGERFYDVGYERGPWSRLCGALMELLACPNISNVWYFGDNEWLEDRYDRPTTIDDVLEISRHYMLNGNRPYDIQRGTSCSR